MTTQEKLAAYRDAFKHVNGYAPHLTQIGKRQRWRITTKYSATDATLADIEKLTNALERMAA